ncbi:MAG TPA: extracellular solute-binding protein [Chloroflexota bacterium]|nr:extracellular solute-binding protein [Chloroflexota bacterium]
MVSGNKFDAGERLSWAQETAAEFSRLHGPQLTAEHVVISGDALFAAMAAGSGPDVTQASGSWFSDFAHKGQLQDITAYVKRDKVDLNRWYLQEETFVRQGKQYGMPSGRPTRCTSTTRPSSPSTASSPRTTRPGPGRTSWRRPRS